LPKPGSALESTGGGGGGAALASILGITGPLLSPAGGAPPSRLSATLLVV
jgi:hypothetical protein